MMRAKEITVHFDRDESPVCVECFVTPGEEDTIVGPADNWSQGSPPTVHVRLAMDADGQKTELTDDELSLVAYCALESFQSPRPLWTKDFSSN